MQLKIFLVSAAILGICQGGLAKGRYEIVEKGENQLGKPYLMGGDKVGDRFYPSMVSIWYKGHHVCGGVILTGYWILTAAQCLLNRSPPSLTAVVGSNDLYSGVRHSVKEIILHEHYDPADSWRNDIALLRVQEPITLKWGTQPAELAPQDVLVAVGTNGVVIGWGSAEAGGDPSSFLKSINVSIWDTLNCTDTYEPYHLNIYPGQFCAGNNEGRGTFDGDTGGPLFIDNKVFGIVSWRKSYGERVWEYPTVYTQVEEYTNWINFFIHEM